MGIIRPKANAVSQAYSFYSTLVGQKVLMAVTGAILFLFLIGHLVGNLQIFAGPDRLNSYAAFLKHMGGLLWIVRAILLIALILHIAASIIVSIANWRGRAVSYIAKKDIATSYAARTMVISGPLILLYVIYHLMMFTFLTTGPGYSPNDVYGNVVAAFRVPAISIVYINAMLVLGYHLYHGVWSMLQTAGLEGMGYKRLRWIMAPTVAALIAGGYIIIPVGVRIGAIR